MPDDILADEEKEANISPKEKGGFLEFVKAPKPRRYLLIMMFNLYV